MIDCRACAYCGIEPDDMNFHCSHPATGNIFGLYVDRMRKPGAPCGPDATLFVQFVQHPRRNPDGGLAPSTVGDSGPDTSVPGDPQGASIPKGPGGSGEPEVSG